MNIQKGFFRLMVVVSIIVGVAFPIMRLEKHPYTIYEVKRAKSNDVEEATAKFKWSGEYRPTPSQLGEIFKEINPERLAETNITFIPMREGKGSVREITADDLLKDEDIAFKQVESNPFLDLLPGPPNFTFLNETKRPIKWTKFITDGMKAFASLWFIYLFVRVVIFSFIVKGFSGKEV